MFHLLLEVLDVENFNLASRSCDGQDTFPRQLLFFNFILGLSRDENEGAGGGKPVTLGEFFCKLKLSGENWLRSISFSGERRQAGGAFVSLPAFLSVWSISLQSGSPFAGPRVYMKQERY